MAMTGGYRFGEFRVHPASRQLWRGERLVALPPPVFDCLTYLIEHHDRAVGRDELVAAVWGKSEISDTLLRQTILRIRRELGDEGKEQRVLRTIQRFGYHWVAPLESDEPARALPSSASLPSPATAEAQPVIAPDALAPDRPVSDAPEITIAAADAVAAAVPARQSPRLALAAVAVAALLVIATAWLLHRQHVQTLADAALSAHAGASVSAVLPASIEPTGSEWSWMRFGIMDATAARLRSAGLPSVPTDNVVALLARPEAHRSGDIRATLAADLLVTPRVERLADDWRIELVADDGAGRHYAVEAQGRDAIEAARAAADRLLAALGHSPVESGSEHAESALVRRIDAAVLADDPDTARALIAKASAEEQQSPVVRLRLAKIDYRGGRLDAARERLIAMLDEAPANTAPVLRASILNGLGAVMLAQGKLPQADRYFGDAVALLEPHTEPEQLGQALLGRAGVAKEQRQFHVAAAYYARARIAYRQANDTLALIRVAANEGFVDYDLRRPARALTQLVAATEGFKQWGALNEALLTYIGQIACDLAMLDNLAAMQAADAADALAVRVDNRHTLDRFRVARSRALIAAGRLREARGLLDEVSRSSADADTAAAAEISLARLALDDDDAAGARRLAGHARLALTAPTNSAPRADAWLIEFRSEMRAANRAQAAKTLDAFEQWAAQTDQAHAHLYSRLARAEFAYVAGDDNWRRDFDVARDLAEHDGIPREIVMVAISYTEALLASGDLDAAAVESGRVGRWSEQDFACAILEARLYVATGRDEARQTAVANARLLAGERPIPAEVLSAVLSQPAR